MTLRRCFNPRARGGRDIYIMSGLSFSASFNPRARGGRDIMLLAFLCLMTSFNPRARGGRDVIVIREISGNGRFQSTRPRGARPATEREAARSKICFNPRARGGRDLQIGGGWLIPVGFNPRARGGRDTFSTDSYRARCVFQSTRPRGARPWEVHS